MSGPLSPQTIEQMVNSGAVAMTPDQQEKWANAVAQERTIPVFASVITVAIATTAGVLLYFLSKKDGGGGVKVRRDSPNPDSERAFAVSTDHFQDAHETLTGLRPSEG